MELLVKKQSQKIKLGTASKIKLEKRMKFATNEVSELQEKCGNIGHKNSVLKCIKNNLLVTLQEKNEKIAELSKSVEDLSVTRTTYVSQTYENITKELTIEWNKNLEQERAKHQNELNICKKKNWCVRCAQEGINLYKEVSINQ